MAKKISRRILIIGKTLRFFERYFFDPKLKKSLALAVEELVLTRNQNSSEEIVCFDIGANRGQTIKLIRELFPNSKIYAFEPHPEIYTRLNSIYKFATNIKCFNLAIGELSGKFPFWVSPLDETSSLHLPNSESSMNKRKALILGIEPKDMYQKIDVEVITLDEFVLENKIEKIDILKIDVEGGEFQVLLGGSNVFKQNKVSIVQYEIHDDDLRPSQEKQIVNFLKEFGFTEYSTIKHAFGNFSDKIYIKYK
jgi:FkbM family methyltransferase